ncbi:MAG TPA: YkvA family protein [Blastocatellia bacterium]|nr:YkvA family protein [Blastocatellia bacterium]
MNTTSQPKKISRKDRKSLRHAMAGLLLFIPRLLKLLFKLLRDKRVSNLDKAILAGAIIYVISPLDFIPDFIPFIGQVDDIYIVALAILRLINRSGENVVAQHWDGDIDIKELAETIVNLAVVFLPKKVGDALVRKVNQPDNQNLRLVKVKEKPVK